MPQLIPIDRLILEIQKTGFESVGVNDLLAKSSQRLKALLEIDQVVVQELLVKDVHLSPAEEMALNTGKVFLDNQLSEYSAFPELIEFYRAGYKSCALLPIEAEGKRLGVLILLSRQEGAFGTDIENYVSVLGRILSIEAYMKLEKEKSLSVARYFDAAFNSAVPQVLMESGGNIMKANKWMLNLADISARDVQGKNIRDLFKIGNDELVGLVKGKPIRVRSAGKGISFVLSSAKISDKLTHVLAQDISENEELGNKTVLLDIGNDVFMLLDNSMKVLWVSRNVDRELRLSEDAVLGRRLLDIVVEPEALVGKMPSAADSQCSTPLRISVGNDMFLDVKLTAFKNAAGYSCVISRDYEKVVSSAQRLVDEITKLSNDVIIKIDSMGNISGINRAAERILGYSNGEFSSASVGALCADRESQSRLGEALLIAKRTGVVTPMLLNLMSKSSEGTVPVEASVLSLTDQSGKLSGYIISGKELATKRRMEIFKDAAEEMGKQVERLKSESDLKTQFIYNISHDLKTPLTSIKGYSKLMSEGEFGAVTEEQKSSLETILGEVDRLMGLILQILDVAKLASGKIKLDMQQVNFNSIAENPSVKALAERARSLGLEFDISVDYNTPEISADPNRLIQVFVNLIDNALKFTEKGGVHVNVTRKGRNVRVEVTDTGLGIREEDRIKLFRKFYQVSRKDLTMQPKAGTGLGLSIVKEIVNLHKGRVGVRSDLGKGSTFWFTLPIEKGAEKKRKKQDTQKDQAGTE